MLAVLSTPFLTGICECPVGAAARRRFVYATGYDFAQDAPYTVQSLIPVVMHVRSNAHLVGELAKFVFDLRASRRHSFRQLTSNGRLGHARVLIRLSWERWRHFLTLPRP